MDYIIEGVIGAFKLILSLDKEIYSIVLLSIYVSFASTVISSIIGVPLGLITGIKEFRGKRLLSKIYYTFMGLPPVVVGLVTVLIISRSGPLGSVGLIYTPTAMIIAQSLLVTPIITGIIFTNSKDTGLEIINICKTLGANKRHTFFKLIKELKPLILVATVTGFGRAISEVGAVMIVGGNIKGHTRVMTTFIAMSNSMGNYDTSIAMGIILLTISFAANSFLYNRTMGDSNGYKIKKY